MLSQASQRCHRRGAATPATPRLYRWQSRWRGHGTEARAWQGQPITRIRDRVRPHDRTTARPHDRTIKERHTSTTRSVYNHLELIRPLELRGRSGRSAQSDEFARCAYIFLRHRPCVHGIPTQRPRWSLKRVAGTACWCPTEVLPTEPYHLSMTGPGVDFQAFAMNAAAR